MIFTGTRDGIYWRLYWYPQSRTETIEDPVDTTGAIVRLLRTSYWCCQEFLSVYWGLSVSTTRAIADAEGTCYNCRSFFLYLQSPQILMGISTIVTSCDVHRRWCMYRQKLLWRPIWVCKSINRSLLLNLCSRSTPAKYRLKVVFEII